jgi:DNA-binding LacI/PurR family transcriptional regulator
VSASRPTISDIARAAGVSPSTVSRALNNHPTIPESTRDHIQGLARQMNYRVDTRARNFRLQRSQTVATLFPYQGASRRQISDPFYLEMLGAITDELDRRGYDSLIARVPAESTDWCARYILDKRVDGILMIDRALDEAGIRALNALDAKFVIWCGPVEGTPFASTGSDGRLTGRDAVLHLAAQGRRRIGFIGGFQRMVETDLRRQGYIQGMHEAGLPVDPDLMLFTDFSAEAAAHAVPLLLKREPKLDAIFACSDFMAIACMRVLQAGGRAVPGDVAVMGHDDIALASQTSPRLTTIRQPIQQGGRLMVQALFEQFDGAPPRQIVLPHELVVRESA